MKNIIEHDKLDTYEYNDVFKQSERLQETVSEGQKRLSTVDSLSEDVFYSLYKNIPKKHDTENIDDGYKINENFIDKVMRSKEYEKIRIGSKLDKLTSALGTQSFTKNVLSEFSDEELEEMDKQAQNAKQNRKQIQQLKDRIQGFQESGNQDKADNLKEQLQKIQKQHEEQMNQMKNNMEKNTSRIRSVIRKSLEKAKETTDNVEGMLSGWGMESAQRESMTWEEKMELAEELKDNSKLQKISDMIGKMKRLAISAQKQKITKVPEEVQSITQGDDLSSVLPSELIHLDEETENIFYKRYIEKELLQYELEGNEPEGKGPIICCIDTSDSMMGDREIWSKGIAMGLYNIAKRQDRDFHVILFSTDLEYFSIEQNTNKEQREKILKMLKTFVGGGTDFNKPLLKAIEIINDVDDRCDIVFITDGEALVSDKTLEQLESQEELFIVGIGISNDAGGLDDFSDSVYMIENILREGRDTAEEVFRRV